MGEPQSGKGFADYKVARMEVHPGAKWTEFEDYLAVLFLEKDVEFSGKINLLLKCPPNSVSYLETICFVIE